MYILHTQPVRALCTSGITLLAVLIGPHAGITPSLAQSTGIDLPEADQLPVPKKRPDQQDGEAETMPADPQAGDDDTRTAEENSNRSQESAKKEVTPESGVTLTAVDMMAQEACEAELDRLQVEFVRKAPINDGVGCVVPIPLQVSHIGPSVELKQEGTLNCSTALALARWTNEYVIPAVGKAFPGRKLTAIHQASTYVCRSRSDGADAKLSEHAIANAIDISAFEFDDGSINRVSIRQGTGTMEEVYQKAVRFSACLHFTTVLGPLSDANHADHFHFDLAQRRGGYRQCSFPEFLLEDAGVKGEDTPQDVR